jgi:hypothetical protein
VFRGDAARWNPAELPIAALSACHQLWYLHLCADAGIVRPKSVADPIRKSRCRIYCCRGSGVGLDSELCSRSFN